MMLVISIAFTVVVLLGLLVQGAGILQVMRSLASSTAELVSNEDCPPAAIVLSLRGGDPFLTDCLNRLVEQDYPDFELFIALDNDKDPAVKYVEQLIAEKNPKNLTTRVISARSQKCTLLNNNYAQMVEELDPRFEFVVFVDADAVTWPGWLRSLLRPLILDSTLGGTSGNRWYTPNQINVGTLVRSVWNMGSLVQMSLFDYPWGGSMALRSDVAKSEEMLGRWRSTFTGDTPTYEIIKECGKSYQFNPDVILLNRENTTLEGFSNWMPRQMLNGKLYHPKWTPVVLQAIGSSLFLIAALIVNLISIVTLNWLAFSLLGGALMVFWIAIFVLFLMMNSVIEDKAKVRGEKVGWLTAGAALSLFFVIPLVQFVYFFGVLRCLKIRNVTWRGIDYVIKGPYEIELVEYKPFLSEPECHTQSL